MNNTLTRAERDAIRERLEDYRQTLLALAVLLEKFGKRPLPSTCEKVNEVTRRLSDENYEIAQNAPRLLAALDAADERQAADAAEITRLRGMVLEVCETMMPDNRDDRRCAYCGQFYTDRHAKHCILLRDDVAAVMAGEENV